MKTKLWTFSKVKNNHKNVTLRNLCGIACKFSMSNDSLCDLMHQTRAYNTIYIHVILKNSFKG